MLPSSIVGLVRERLSRLPGATVELLRTAALIGRTFEVTFLAEVLGQEAEAVEESLLAAVRAGLIREDSPGTFTFSHDKGRECLYTEVTSTRRRRLHGFIGRILETQADRGSAQHLADLAFHFTQSGDRRRGAHYARRAAEQAWHASAFEDAMKQYRVALEFLPPEDNERGTLLLRLGEAAILAGAEREAIAAFEEARDFFQERQDKLGAARGAHGLGRAWSRLEAHASAQAALETALVRLADHPGPELVHVLVDLAALLGIAQLLQGKRHEALTCINEVEALLTLQQEGSMLIADALSKLALIALLLGDRERVADYYPRVLPCQGRGMEFLLDRVLGEMETLLGSWSQAHVHLSAAEEMARREGVVPELASTLVAQGKLALAQGGRGSVTRARTVFEQAHALFQELGVQAQAQALREQLEHLPGKSPIRKARPLPAGLSEREVEVLRLIVAGKSNRQIADELILSERTVANHLAHIFNKTGTDNRAAAAAFAIRHGLA